MIKDVKPDNFNPKFEVVSCFVEFNSKILLLKRQFNKPQPNTYGVVAGKVECDESIIEAIVREAREETGADLLEDKLGFYKTKYVEYEEYHFVYHMFFYKLDQLVEIKIDPNSHQEYIWEYPEKCLELNLIQDLDKCIIDYYRINSEESENIC